MASSPIAPKKRSTRSGQKDKDSRSYAYVAAIPRSNSEDDEIPTPVCHTKECKTQTAPTVDTNINISDSEENQTVEDNLVQSSLKVNGRQNLTVSAGSGSVFYFHYPLPSEGDPDYDPARRNSAPSSHHSPKSNPIVSPVIDACRCSSAAPSPRQSRKPTPKVSAASLRCNAATIETDGIASEEGNDDEEVDSKEIDDKDGGQVDAGSILHTIASCQLSSHTKASPVQSCSVQPRSAGASIVQQRRLVLIGYTGGGKSETGNSILCDRDLFDSLPGFASITKDCHKSTGTDIRCHGDHSAASSSRPNNEVVVVDTPGLFDTNDDPEVIAKKITGCIINVSPGPHAILLVTPIARMTTEVQQAADGLRKLFGDRSLQYMIVIFTHLDAIKRKKSITGIDELVSMAPPALFRILQECNNRYVAFDNTLDPESSENKAQVSELLDLVDQMVENNGGKCYTNDLLEEANRLMEMEKNRHEREIEEKFQEREARIRSEYEKHLAIIDTKQRQLEEVQEKRRQLEENRSKELQRRIERQQSQIKNKEDEHAQILETEKVKYAQALNSMNTTLDELQRDLRIVESEKDDLVKRESDLSEELLSAMSERDRTTNYLKRLGTELQKELNVPLKIDPRKPPKDIVDVVRKRVKRCSIL